MKRTGWPGKGTAGERCENRCVDGHGSEVTGKTSRGWMRNGNALKKTFIKTVTENLID